MKHCTGVSKRWVINSKKLFQNILNQSSVKLCLDYINGIQNIEGSTTVWGTEVCIQELQ